MLKLSIVVRMENAHGSSEALVMVREGKDAETVERELIQNFYIDGAQSLCDAIHALEPPRPAITTKKGNKNAKG